MAPSGDSPGGLLRQFVGVRLSVGEGQVGGSGAASLLWKGPEKGGFTGIVGSRQAVGRGREGTQ